MKNLFYFILGLFLMFLIGSFTHAYASEVPANTFFFMDNKGYDVNGTQKYFCLMDNNCYTLTGSFAFSRGIPQVLGSSTTTPITVPVVTPVMPTSTPTQAPTSTIQATLVLNKSYVDSTSDFLHSPIRVLSKGVSADIKSFNYSLFNNGEAAFLQIKLGSSDSSEYFYNGNLSTGSESYGDYILLNPLHTSIKESIPLLTMIQSSLTKYSLQIVSITCRIDGEDKDRTISVINN